MFPAQDVHRGEKSLGNLIALPLQKAPRDRDNSVFVDHITGNTADQWGLLASLRRLTEEQLDSALLAPMDDKFSPMPRPRLSRPDSQSESGSWQVITLGEHLAIPEANCPRSVRSFLCSETWG